MKVSFNPIVNNDSKVLILGTMPGEESLQRQEYYAHKYNQFWRIMFALFNEEITVNYELKKQFLLKNKIALWDVLAYCERNGSLDSAIKNEKPNNFPKLFSNYPSIKHICFSSRKAEAFYDKYIGKSPDKNYYTLPSPSSANARKSFEEKLNDWMFIQELAK